MSTVLVLFRKHVETYPKIYIAIGAFTVFYGYRSFNTYKLQKKKNTSNNQLHRRLINSALALTSIAQFAAQPLIYSTIQSIKPRHVVLYSAIQVPYWFATDYFTSNINAAQHNIKSLQANGFSPLRIVIYSLANAILFYVPTYYFVRKLGLNEFKQYKDTINISLPLKMMLNLIIGEFIFTTAHRTMHKNKSYGVFAAIHVMHHACYTSGISTSLCFNPIDAILEVGLGILAPVAISYGMNKDKLAAILSLCLQLGWYHSSHDENIGELHATKHHAYCMGNFNIYFHQKGNAEQDQVRKMLVRGYGFQKSK